LIREPDDVSPKKFLEKSTIRVLRVLRVSAVGKVVRDVWSKTY
jgi:hypothetical protein